MHLLHELHLCHSAQKLAAGVDDSGWWEADSESKRGFFSLTGRDKQTFTQRDVSGASLPDPPSSVCFLFLVMNEGGQSMTEIQSKQMALCLNPLPNISSHSELLGRCEGCEYKMSLFPTISELHHLRLHFLTRQCQTFITSHQSVIYNSSSDIIKRK